MTSEDDIKGLVSLKFLRPWGRLELGGSREGRRDRGRGSMRKDGMY
jgi:hypothetical protein